MVPLDHSEQQMVPIRDLNQHTEATTIAVYIPLHMLRLDQYLSTDCACEAACPLLRLWLRSCRRQAESPLA